MTNRTVSIKITKSTSVKGLFHSYTRLLSYEIQQTQLANLQIRLYLLKCARQKRLTPTTWRYAKTTLPVKLTSGH